MKYSAVALLFVSSAVSANNAYFVSGSGETSTYKNGYAPPAIEAITPITENALFGQLMDRDGNGTVGNVETCAAETEALCFGIGQGNIVANMPQIENGEVCIIRADLEPEYSFLFTNGRLKDWGSVHKNWIDGRLTIVTSASSSGSVATLQQIIESSPDYEKATVVKVDNWDEVIQQVKSNDRIVGFTHRYADASGFLDTLGDEHDLLVFGMAERSLRSLNHKTGEPIFRTDEVPFNISKRTLSVQKTVSMGTPVVLFGNCPERLANAGDHGYAHEVHKEISALPVDKFAVDLGFVTNFVNKHITLVRDDSNALWEAFEQAKSAAKLFEFNE
jgi:tRNA(Leu) C34 or U34 (ribose-2'-O)-methylase TrmL